MVLYPFTVVFARISFQICSHDPSLEFEPNFGLTEPNRTFGSVRYFRGTEPLDLLLIIFAILYRILVVFLFPNVTESHASITLQAQTSGILPGTAVSVHF